MEAVLPAVVAFFSNENVIKKIKDYPAIKIHFGINNRRSYLIGIHHH